MNEVQISLDYHSADGKEIIQHHNTSMTRNEMRALMVWMGRLKVSDFPSENAAVAAARIHSLLSTANREITEEERTVPGRVGE
jgi:hypothetical protein